MPSQKPTNRLDLQADLPPELNVLMGVYLLY